MIIRIRPAQLFRRTRLLRISSGADVALALTSSMIFTSAGLICFTLFCWNRHENWLAFAVVAWLIAQLSKAFAELANNPTTEADEQPTKGLRELALPPK